jgi:pimeloyl-ACP methyl ester carboxylesterase
MPAEEQDFDVYTFGYRTSYFRGAPIDNAAIQLATALEELAQRRDYEIVLIAHSMGGLVCMRYILDQLERNQVPPILGLLLYGTPATGSDLIKIARLVGFGIGIKLPPVRWLVNLFLKSQRQITDLATGSRFLTSLQANWVYRVINGGHESAAPGRMWLPVCVVTAEDDVFVSEESGKGLYGAIDWRPKSGRGLLEARWSITANYAARYVEGGADLMRS